MPYSLLLNLALSPYQCFIWVSKNDLRCKKICFCLFFMLSILCMKSDWYQKRIILHLSPFCIETVRKFSNFELLINKHGPEVDFNDTSEVSENLEISFVFTLSNHILTLFLPYPIIFQHYLIILHCHLLIKISFLIYVKKHKIYVKILGL